MAEWKIDKWKIGCWSVAYLCFLTLLFSGISFLLYQCATGDSTGPGSSEPSEESKKSEAAVYCKMYVQRTLKAPSTADFPWVIQAEHIAGNYYEVNSYVDAENSFGAKIRTYYNCRVEYTGGGYEGWKLESFTTSP